MNRLPRLAGIAAVVAVVLGFVSLGMAPKWPAANATAAVVREYFRQNGRAFLLQTSLSWVCFGLIGYLFAALAEGFTARGRQTCGRWQLLGGGAAVCGLVVGSVPWAAIAYQVPAEDGVLLFAWNLGLLGAFTAVGPLLASALVPAGVGIIYSGVLPKWIGGIALLSAAVSLMLGFAWQPSGPMSPNGEIGLLAVLTFILFQVTSGVAIIRGSFRN
jgi:hypothetical protein